MDRLSPRLKQPVAEAVAIFKSGGVVAFPTDTVYSLGCDYRNREAVFRIYEVKGRPSRKALPILLGGIGQIDGVALDFPDVAWKLAAKFWPGALTLVLKKRPSVPDFITAGSDTVAVRVPAHPVALALVKGLGAPIVGTSANLSGQPSALNAEEVRASLGNRVDMVVDGGRVPGGKESTIIDVSGEKPVILREGAISRAELERFIQTIT
jgi:L-threonylcarbamoyladenylate synthase